MLARAFDSSPIALEHREYLLELRAIFPYLRPEQYRGIERNPLNPDMDHRDPGWEWSPVQESDEGATARRRLAEILGVVEGEWNEETWLNVSPWLVPERAAAQELLDMLRLREEHEIVHVARHPARSMVPSIGFDVGYWATENFSIVCDSAIWPKWHPADSEALNELKRQLEPLNAYGLFPNAETAAAFREWYRSQAWAETEDEDETGRFELIEISLVESRGPVD